MLVAEPGSDLQLRNLDSTSSALPVSPSPPDHETVATGARPSFSAGQHICVSDDNGVVSVIGRDRTQPPYRLYKMRFAGVAGIIALNIVAGANLTWFGPIANDTSDAFGISLDQVNWLGNIIGVTYLVVAPLVPIFCSRYGLRACFLVGTVFLVISAWVRYAGTTRSLTPRGAYTLLIIGQFLSAFPQVIFQVLAPKFSETWFNLQGRTTATMLMSISNPIGAAVGQLISPIVTDPRDSVLVLGIISTAISPFVLLVGSRPPTPPSYSGSQPSPHFFTTLRAIFGLLSVRRPTAGTSVDAPHSYIPPHTVNNHERDLKLELDRELEGPAPSVSKPESTQDGADVQVRRLSRDADAESVGQHRTTYRNLKGEVEQVVDEYMTLRERVDFIILSLVFGVLVAGINTFSLLSNELLEPYGYSEDTAGFMGAALLLSGLAAAFATSPLFDRVLTHHLGHAVRIFAPPIAAAWLALIWVARPNNAGALYAIFVVIGVCSLSILPVGLELGCELTRNSGASSAILWLSGNLFSIIFILVMSVLRAPESASPPKNMHRALIFNGVTIFVTTMSIFLFRGRQRRREEDARAAAATTETADRGNVGDRSEDPVDARERWIWRRRMLPMGVRFFRR
ncbi:hypothetical protein M0805_001355 [Coniferiporia weirii]|nr:hypothetical protein M0805_001355 [Coniferiporia weirii]